MNKILLFSLLLFTVLFAAANDIYAEETSKVSPTPTVDLWTNFKGPVRDDPRIIGKSFTFKGRAGYDGGNLTSLKIWKVGTHRVVGVLTDNCIPDNLKAIFRNDLGAQVYGIFTVYAFTLARKGVMQFVCIDSVQITKVIKSQ